LAVQPKPADNEISEFGIVISRVALDLNVLLANLLLS